MKSKDALRIELKEKRAAISDTRRKQASDQLLLSLYPLLAPYKTVLSFVSFTSEIDTRELNRKLLEEGRLLLPAIVQDEIVVYHVSSLEKLIRLPSGMYEPDVANESLCELHNISSILVPGLGFDRNYHRVGFGKGHFDRFLLHVPHAIKIGIGFKEQWVEEKIPTEQHDIALDQIILF